MMVKSGRWILVGSLGFLLMMGGLGLAMGKKPAKSEEPTPIKKSQEEVQTEAPAGINKVSPQVKSTEQVQGEESKSKLITETVDLFKPIKGSSPKKAKADDPAQEIFDKGEEYLEQSKFDEAIEQYQKVVNDYPEHLLAPEALLRISYCYGAKDEYEIIDAIDALQKIIEDYPTTIQAANAPYLIGGWYAVLEDYENAIKYYQERITKHPEKSEVTKAAYFGMGVCYFRLGNYTTAISIYQKVIDDYPDDIRLVKSFGLKYGIAQCYEALWRVDEALEIYEEAVKKADPRVIRLDGTRYHIGELYEWKEDYEKARYWFQKVIDDYPESDLVDDAEEKLEKLEGK